MIMIIYKYVSYILCTIMTNDILFILYVLLTYVGKHMGITMVIHKSTPSTGHYATSLTKRVRFIWVPIGKRQRLATPLPCPDPR